MNDVLYILLGGCLAVAAWFAARARAGRGWAERLEEARQNASALEKAASASGAVEGELRSQLERKDAEVSSLRSELAAEREGKVEADTRLEEAEKGLADQKARIEEMKKELTDTFNALSSAALKSSSEDFLRLAGEHLGKLLAETGSRLGEHKAAMDGLLNPLGEALKKYEEQIRSIELNRKQDYTSLDEQIKTLAITHRELRKETGNLVSALRKPHVRGRWGEVTLRNVVELAGMSAHCDFTEQVSVSTESGRLRPDMVVRLPGGRSIVVDSKVSMEALLDAFSAESEEARRECVKRHVSHVRDHMTRLGSKAYWSQFERSPELAVLFMGDSALSAALEAEPTILEDSLSKKVLMATPTTLFALLSAVAYGWRQEQAARNSEAIAEVGRQLYERVGVWAGHLNDIGKELTRAVAAYNKAAGSMESRVMPSVRKLRELGASKGSEEIPALRDAEGAPRDLLE